jgi:hypothetical protein
MIDGKPCVMTQTGETKFEAVTSAPNGSTRNNVDYWTHVTYVQDWVSGSLAGYSYTIVERYLSSNPKTRGQFINSGSTFLSGPDN